MLFGFERASYGPCLAEAFAIREALLWLKSLQMDNEIVELDCQMLVKALSRQTTDVSEFGELATTIAE